MSYKPLNEKRLAIYGYNLQPIQATAARQLFPRLEENEDHKRFAQDLLPICSLLHADKVCEEQTTAGWEWEVFQDIIFCKIRAGVEWRVLQRLLYLGFGAQTARFLFLLLAELEATDLAEQQRGTTWRGTADFLAPWEANDWFLTNFFCLQWSVRQEEYMLCFTGCVRLWERAKVPDGVYCPRLAAKWDDYVKTAHVTIISGIRSRGTAYTGPDPPCLPCMHTQIIIYMPLMHMQEDAPRNYFT